MFSPDKKKLQYLSWLTLFGMSAIGILLIQYGQGRSVRAILLGSEPHYPHIGHKKYFIQLASGIFFGSFSAILGTMLIKAKFLKNVRSFFEEMIGEINPSIAHIIFFSVCAGIGEEMLFRAGLQPIAGIWPVAIFFVLLHGYINPSNLSLSIYGAFLIVVSAGFGYLFRYFGIFSAITAHIVYDISMFCVLKYAYGKK